MVMCQFSVAVKAGLCWLIKNKYMDYFCTSFSWTFKLLWQIIHLWLPAIWTHFHLCKAVVPSVKSTVQWYQEFWAPSVELKRHLECCPSVFCSLCDLKGRCYWQHGRANLILFSLQYLSEKVCKNSPCCCLPQMVYLCILSIFLKHCNTVNVFHMLKSDIKMYSLCSPKIK